MFMLVGTSTYVYRVCYPSFTNMSANKRKFLLICNAVSIFGKWYAVRKCSLLSDIEYANFQINLVMTVLCELMVGLIILNIDITLLTQK